MDTCIYDLGSMSPRLTFPSSAAVGIISYCDIGEALMKEFHKVVLFSGAGAISTQLCFFSTTKAVADHSLSDHIRMTYVSSL
jgi:hypothetical protein